VVRLFAFVVDLPDVFTCFDLIRQDKSIVLHLDHHPASSGHEQQPDDHQGQNNTYGRPNL
jgi:hypothetical protein